MYIIKTGQVGIFKNQYAENPLATLSINEFFGEMALISNHKRNATAKTLSECEVFVLHKDAFKELMRTNPEIANTISDEIIRRTNENEAKFGDEKDETASIFN